MLNYKNTNRVLFACITMLLILPIELKSKILILSILLIIYIGLIVRGCLFINVNYFIQSLCSSNTNEKKIAITFDDGPDKVYTNLILEILKKEEVESCFFCIGKNVVKNPELIRKINQQGHIIGNHSFSHDFWFDMKSQKLMTEDLKKNEDEIFRIINKRTQFFRPPYGVTNPNLKKAINQLKYKSIGWNMRSFDTTAKNEEELLNKIKKRLKPGSIYLFHDNIKITTQVLSEFINYSKNQGYQFVRLDKLLNINCYA